ncbi:phosphatase PAP2 family protein [Thalassolituus sp. LLYu03]|uniref:phosphatase PAP2 family protein n=1 Tax=Thalassolituus sp. LLYu03 TaxID=3421656 RepID=UPI003D2A2AB6
MNPNQAFVLRPLTLAVAAALLLTACGEDDNNTDAIDTSVSVTKAALPTGLGFEQYVALPDVAYPLPAITYAANNGSSDSSVRYSVDHNAIAYAQRGINSIWMGTTAEWQSAASSSGPGEYKADADAIVDSTNWTKNIEYVVDVTTNRSEDRAILAFLDDRRSKNYSVVDGFGPLTEDYAAASGAYTDIRVPSKAQVLTDTDYLADGNDSSIYAGDVTSELGDVVQMVMDFRYQIAPASTSAPKYIFSTPRPWRIKTDGTIDLTGSETVTCKYPDTATAEQTATGTEDRTFDVYTTDVQIVPGLLCQRRTGTNSMKKDGAYPSGHTNAGTLAALAYAYSFPQRFSELVFRGSELGESRIVAGMHSPVDVIGARIQALIDAAYSLNSDTGAAHGDAAVMATQSYFGAKAAAAGMSLFDYAHQTVTNGSYSNGSNVNVEVFNNNFYDDHAAIKAEYLARMTYGFTQDSSKAGQAAVVPLGAEALLKSRQPYLSDEQRRAVLATTEVDSGYPILDDSEGWGRINLVAAADGYGAFDGDVNVYMEAGKGGFNAKDWWRNDISGEGKLTKAGSGELVLTGTNTFSGGAVVEAGVLTAASASAMGSGTVFVQGGELAVDADGALALQALTVEPAASLSVAMDDDSVQVAVTGNAYVQGAALQLSFATTPASGTRFTVLTADQIGGEFASVYAGDVSVSLSYESDRVIARIE